MSLGVPWGEGGEANLSPIFFFPRFFFSLVTELKTVNMKYCGESVGKGVCVY